MKNLFAFFWRAIIQRFENNCSKDFPPPLSLLPSPPKRYILKYDCNYRMIIVMIMKMITMMTMIVITTMRTTMMMTMSMKITMKITMTIMKMIKITFVRRYSHFWTYQIQLFFFSLQCFIVHIILTILLVACTLSLVFYAHEMSKAYDSLPLAIRINLDELYLALVIYNGSLSFKP